MDPEDIWREVEVRDLWVGVKAVAGVARRARRADEYFMVYLSLRQVDEIVSLFGSCTYAINKINCNQSTRAVPLFAVAITRIYHADYAHNPVTHVKIRPLFLGIIE